VQAAAAVGIPSGTAYHILNTLVTEGILSRDRNRRYQLGPKIAALAVAFARRGPSEKLLNAVRSLAESTGETAYLSAWQDGQVVALATIEGSSAVRVGRIHDELRGHEHSRASGKVMLAHLESADLDAYLATHSLDALTPQTVVDDLTLRTQLESVRRLGYAVDEAEFTDSVGCVSAPVFENSTCIASLTISVPLERFRQNRDELSDAVVRAALDASHSIQITGE
jgi:DNA-binding IclR family transcriptional regulator